MWYKIVSEYPKPSTKIGTFQNFEFKIPNYFHLTHHRSSIFAFFILESYLCSMGNYLDNSVKYVPGVGEARAKLLEKELGIITIGDLLRHYPFRYVDRTKIYPIAEVNESMDSALVQIRARVTGVAYAGTGRSQRFSAFVSDSSGSAELTWFRGIKWIEKSIEVGREYLIFGRPSFFRGEVSMVHPELDLVEKALSRKNHSGMQGIYPSTEKIGSTLGAKGFYKIICNA